MKRLGILVGLGIGLTALPAFADTLVFSEDWEGPTNTWGKARACNAIQNTLGQGPSLLNATGTNGIGTDLTPIADPAACSGKILRDPNLFSGGMVYLRKKAAPEAPIPVAAGDKFCISAWIRTPTTAVNSGGFVSINYTNSVEGDLIGNYAGNGEHFLIGSEADAQYGASAVPLKDGAWHRYQKGWTIAAADLNVAATAANKMVVKTVNFVGGNGSTCNGTNPAQGPAVDFDDIRIYKLAAGEDLNTLCPTGNETTDATNMRFKPRADESTHEVCKGACGKTAMGAQTVYKCAPCDGAFGGGTANACPTAAAPSCVAGECKACDGDNGVMGVTAACGTANPFCKTDGTCGKCATDAECRDTTKNHGTGANKCDTAKGQCANGCTIATEKTDCTNSTRPWCDVKMGASVGICQEKQPNGAPIPNRDGDTDADKGKCTEVNAARFCASAKCDPTDNMCGLANGSECTVAEEANCRADRCGTDNKCGSLEGGPCDTDANCRAGTCVANRCSAGASSSGGSSGAGGSSSGGSSSGDPAASSSGGGDDGCATGSSPSGSGIVLMGIAIAATGMLRRKRK